MKRIPFLVAPLILALIVVGYCYGYRATRRQPIVYQAPGAEAVEVEKDLPWLNLGSKTLALDLYRPAGAKAGEALPAVVFVHGDGPERVIESFKDWGQMSSWARNVAASGLVAITFDHSSTELLEDIGKVADEVDTLLDHVRRQAPRLGVDPDRLCLWTCSSGGPFALRSALREKPESLRCLVGFYPALGFEAFPEFHTQKVPADVWADFSLVRSLGQDPEKVPPILLAKASQDSPQVNATLDAFAAEAEKQGVRLELLVHETGNHAFDLGSDDERSREIIRRTLEFMKESLESPSSPGDVR